MRNKNINKVIGEGFVGLQKEVGELRKQVAERDALLASKQAEIDALMVDYCHDEMARLGNGDSYGNSIGNVMAQDALSAEAGQQRLLDKQAELLELTEAAIAAPRCFFMGLEQGRKNLESMREHLDRCRDDYSCWPTWAKEGTGRITESGKAILVFAMMAYELRKQGEIK